MLRGGLFNFCHRGTKPARTADRTGGPYLELFARGTRPGWTYWGDQADDNYAPTWKTYAHNSQSDKKNPSRRKKQPEAVLELALD